MAGIEDHRALLDRGAGDGAVRADHVEVAMKNAQMKTVVVGMERSGLGSVELLKQHGFDVMATDSRPLAELPKAAEALERLGVEFQQQSTAVFEGAGQIVISPGVPADL